MDVVAWSQRLCLLLAMVSAAAIRELDDLQQDQDSCQTYTQEDVVYLDCSIRGLNNLPDELNYNARVLLLYNNNFLTFPTQLVNFQGVEILDLSGNSLTRPLPSYMQNWNSLQTLNLSNNNYDSWLSTEYTFHIKRLDLSKNKINNIDEDAFRRMPTLSFLDLSENRIYDLASGVFTHANNLDTVILSRNFFSEIPSFRSSSLRNLYLSTCQISNIDINSLTGMNSLLKIDLSMNQLETFPDNLASNTLQELDLSVNKISTLTDNSLSSLPHLAVLDLRANEFKEVWATSHFSSNPFLREIRVKGARWSCEGFSVNLLLTYAYLTEDPPKVRDRGSLICYSPSNVTHLSWQRAYFLTWNSEESPFPSFTMMAILVGIIIGIICTSFVCRGIMSLNKSEPLRSSQETTILNANGTTPQPTGESVTVRVPLREDLPPSYDEALLMPRLNSFHSLPDFVDEPMENPRNHYRRSRSIGNLTESRSRTNDRRSVRRAVEIHIN